MTEKEIRDLKAMSRRFISLLTPSLLHLIILSSTTPHTPSDPPSVTRVTEKEIRDLKASGIDTVRIPVGDWMYVPYEPYIGCMDGAMDELNRYLPSL